MMFEQNLNTVSTRAKPCFEVLVRYYVVTFLSDRTLILLLKEHFYTSGLCIITILCKKQEL